MDFCKFRSCKGPSGPYAIRLPLRAREHLAARDLTLFLQHRLNWVEDGLRVVVSVMLTGDAKVSDYLRLAYPDTFAEHQRKTDADETRRTLLYRLRYLLRCLGLVTGHFAQFDLQSFAELKSMLDIFTECVRQAVGDKVSARLKASVSRFARLWETIDFELSTEEAIRHELQILLNDLDEVFEVLREAFREKELAHASTANEISALRAAQEEANRTSRRALHACERLAVEKTSRAAVDAYGRLAGLERIKGAKLEELVACFRYSHEKFSVTRGDKSGAASLVRLAERVWRENRARFEAYARLATDAGYANIKSLAAKLYKLAARYPAADHFRWKE